MHGNPPEEMTAPAPAALPQGLLLSRDQTLAAALTEELRLVLRIALVTGSLQELSQAMHGQDTLALFLHATPKTASQDMNFAEYIRRTHPETDIYLILEHKDPDLLLQALRLGVRDCIFPGNGESEPFLQAVRRSLTRQGEETGGGFVYACYSLKGGQGVTTLSVNLADQIQSVTSGRVLLLDLNLYLGDIHTMLPLTGGFTPFDLIRDLSRMDENLLFSSLFHHANGFHVLPSAVEISDAELVRRDQVAAMIGLLKRHFTHIVIDLPHDFSDRTLAAIENADRVALLVEPGLISMKSAQKVLNFFRELNYSEEKIALILNRSGKKDALQPEDVERVLKQPLFATIGNDWTAFEQAASKGVPLESLHPRRRVTRDLRHLAIRLTGMTDNRPRQGPRAWLDALFANN